ncbi:MAG: hypothetical protein P8Z67_12485 [Gammaproteobacteria bacterium]
MGVRGNRNAVHRVTFAMVWVALSIADDTYLLLAAAHLPFILLCATAAAIDREDYFSPVALVALSGFVGLALKMYYLVFSSVGHHDWWFGALIGALHGLFLLIVAMPLLPHLHPRIATEYDGPDANRRLEPPGFLGLNYGRMTPVTTVIGHMLYGAILGAALPPAIWY